MTEQELTSIGKMCAEFGVTARSLRFYESKELLNPVRRGQHRLFTPRDRARLKLILRGKRFGFSLAEIKELLDLYDIEDSGETQLSETLKRAEVRLEEMKRQRIELDVAITELEAQIRVIKNMLHAPAKPRESGA